MSTNESHHVVAKNVEVDALMVTHHSIIISIVSHNPCKLRKYSKQVLSHCLKEAFRLLSCREQ